MIKPGKTLCLRTADLAIGLIAVDPGPPGRADRMRVARRAGWGVARFHAGNVAGWLPYRRHC